ncbi:50S ribosomal protein L28 [Patescibacteria group bacterium]|nr:50S ribosomal protein L28 [Patescibacteria group bacterium]
MAVCDNCGKKSVVGRNVSHAENRTLRKFRANIQKITFMDQDSKTTRSFCTKCIKRLKKEGKIVSLGKKELPEKTKKSG